MKYVVLDSVSELSCRHQGMVVFCGSHGGKNVAPQIIKYRIKGIVLNDAGIGKDRAGIGALEVLNSKNIYAATVSCMTARIGDGEDTFRNGVISAVNKCADKIGIKVGDNAMRLLEAGVSNNV